jgi:hypothetical protein
MKTLKRPSPTGADFAPFIANTFVILRRLLPANNEFRPVGEGLCTCAISHALRKRSEKAFVRVQCGVQNFCRVR